MSAFPDYTYGASASSSALDDTDGQQQQFDINNSSNPDMLNGQAWSMGGMGGMGSGYQVMQQQHQQQQQPSATDNNAFINILAEMPSSAADPARHAMWMEAVRFKTKSLELAIVEARRQEREAELELSKLKSAVDRRSSFRGHESAPMSSSANMARNVSPPSGNASANTSNMGMGHPNNLAAPPSSSQFGISSPSSHTYSTATYPYLHTRPMLGPPQQTPRTAAEQALPDIPSSSGLGINLHDNPNIGREQAMTPFDLEAILQGSNFDNMFAWLPDLGVGSADLSQAQGTVDPNALRFSDLDMPGFQSNLDSSALELEPLVAVKQEPSFPDPSPSKRRSSSGAESAASDHPPTKKSRKGMEKKIVVEESVSCLVCRRSLARTMVRGLKSQLPDPIVSEFKCLQCAPVDQPTTIPDPNISGSSIGTVESRKRLRTGMELDDDESEAKERRQFCDVCQRVIASGQVRGGTQREEMGFMAEVVCAQCDARYQRCTDCGGGGGPRMGIGKWRLKQVFQPGRKTCSLSHSRLGDRPREIGVHVTPSDFSPEQLNEVLSRCKALWQEKNLSRLAVPEMMEIDLPSNLVNPLRSYSDIEKIIVENWPSREAMIKAEGADRARFKRILGLTWAHTRPRRNVRTVDLEGDYAKTAEADEYEDTSTVLDNVKRTNVVIPAGCELIGMWGGEWDMQHGSILISTFIPFEGTDGEDSTALSVGEIVTKVHSLQQSTNDSMAAGLNGVMSVPPCEHLWVVSGSSVPLVRERMADILTRKRSFVHLEEYLTRHPDFANAVKDRPFGLHPTSFQNQNQHDILNHLPFSEADGAAGALGQNQRPLILARWLGKDFNPEKIREIKQMEFGGKARLKKKMKK